MLSYFLLMRSADGLPVESGCFARDALDKHSNRHAGGEPVRIEPPLPLVIKASAKLHKKAG